VDADFLFLFFKAFKGQSGGAVMTVYPIPSEFVLPDPPVERVEREEEEIQFPAGYPERSQSEEDKKKAEEQTAFEPMEGIPVYGMRAVRIHEIVDALHEHNPNADCELVNRAYVFAATAHQGATRRSGEPYLIHPLSVAWILTDMRQDAVTVAAGLLHDVVEDTKYKEEDIIREFGPSVGAIVSGVTKISKLNFTSQSEREAVNMRRMILAMLTDLRVIFVKLADRLNNMRTLGFMPPEKQKVIARETLEIFAPFAARLGIHKIQSELEDLSFFYLEPKNYLRLRQEILAGRLDRQKYVEEVKGYLHAKMAEFGVACEIEGRPKHMYSVYRKMEEQNVPFDQIFDLVAFRIIVDDIQTCYKVLGIVHSLFRPIPGRLKDYVSLPKPNGYQSIHTAVLCLNNTRVEIQIRTREMHAYAEEGVAAHYRYKDGQSLSEEEAKGIKALKDFLIWQNNLDDPNAYLKSLKESLAEQRDLIFVLTPLGEVKELPIGATPLDFAYAVHTEIGNHFLSAKINGHIGKINQPLNSGDMVEIFTDPKVSPTKDWKNYAVSSKARARIKQWFAASDKSEAEIMGKDLLVAEMRKRRLNKKLLSPEILHKLGYESLNELNVAVATGRIALSKVMEAIDPKLLADQSVAKESPAKERTQKTEPLESVHSVKGVLVKGADEVVVQFAKCCRPIPREDVVGFLTRGRGVEIHAKSCKSLAWMDGSRLVDVAWDSPESQDLTFEALVRVQAKPVKVGMVQILAVLNEAVQEVVEVDAKMAKFGTYIFRVLVQNYAELELALASLRELTDLVETVERLYPGDLNQDEA
jgi:GTP pyrophosphokinase